MNHLLDFPGKKANLRLALLHGFGGCAQRSNARYGLWWWKQSPSRHNI